MSDLKASIVIVTFHRPGPVYKSVQSALAQSPPPHEVIVVDASINDETQIALKDFPSIKYFRVNFGYGHMTRARNYGYMRATGDVLIFIDDDAVAHPHWLENMLMPYGDPSVGAVGGRALNHQLGEDTLGLDQIGKLSESGKLTGFFAADPGRILEVDHVIGCNMSFRMSIMKQQIGLLREYPGTEVREETDTCLRVRGLGYKILFNPAAVVDHIGAPHPHKSWKRFDARYDFYGFHNHQLLLIRNYGPFAAIVWKSYVTGLAQAFSTWLFKMVASCVRMGAATGGLTMGMITGILESFSSKAEIKVLEEQPEQLKKTIEPATTKAENG